MKGQVGFVICVLLKLLHFGSSQTTACDAYFTVYLNDLNVQATVYKNLITPTSTNLRTAITVFNTYISNTAALYGVLAQVSSQLQALVSGSITSYTAYVTAVNAAITNIVTNYQDLITAAKSACSLCPAQANQIVRNLYTSKLSMTLCFVNAYNALNSDYLGIYTAFSTVNYNAGVNLQACAGSQTCLTTQITNLMNTLQTSLQSVATLMTGTHLTDLRTCGINAKNSGIILVNQNLCSTVTLPTSTAVVSTTTSAPSTRTAGSTFTAGASTGTIPASTKTTTARTTTTTTLAPGPRACQASISGYPIDLQNKINYYKTIMLATSVTLNNDQNANIASIAPNSVYNGYDFKTNVITQLQSYASTIMNFYSPFTVSLQTNYNGARPAFNRLMGAANYACIACPTYAGIISYHLLTASNAMAVCMNNENIGLDLDVNDFVNTYATFRTNIYNGAVSCLANTSTFSTCMAPTVQTEFQIFRDSINNRYFLVITRPATFDTCIQNALNTGITNLNSNLCRAVTLPPAK